ncbi:hypothetical protein C0Q70_15602 [Pomacea canaliculata]|uniref:Uncharacterized protein n=1 Tax=Pomacea canaliculata TaxID=400727 RepID=A0A2T7NVC5_POMCA|nr:hypothetical protein C0Q70_15602 [Pomacea canaliculata]
MDLAVTPRAWRDLDESSSGAGHHVLPESPSSLLLRFESNHTLSNSHNKSFNVLFADIDIFIYGAPVTWLHSRDFRKPTARRCLLTDFRQPSAS